MKNCYEDIGIVHTTFMNRLGERVTHYSPRGGLIGNVSFNHADREIAVELEGAWCPIDKLPVESSTEMIQIALAKAMTALVEVNRIGEGSGDDLWDKFISRYEGGL